MWAPSEGFAVRTWGHYTKTLVPLLEDPAARITLTSCQGIYPWEAEEAFVCEALSCDLVGLSSRSMREYIRFVADRLLLSLGCAKLFRAENPFEWMEMISMQGKTNFFEARVSEYQKAHVLSGGQGKAFSLAEDF